MNEYLSNLSNCLGSTLRNKNKQTFLECAARVYYPPGEDEEDDDACCTIEVRLKKGPSNEGLVSFQDKLENEVFDLAFAKNYIVLISTQKNVTIDQVNKEDFKKGVVCLGFLNNKEKNIQELPKVLIPFASSKIKSLWRKDFIECYVLPIEKITTFLRQNSFLILIIREFKSLQLLESSDVNQYIF
jgi:hypothetical protein